MFSLQELRLIAQEERKMDEGTQPYVVDSSGSRWSVHSEVMTLLHLKNGQRVPPVIIRAILEGHLAICNREIAKAADAKTPPA